jgi:hypothetical protein
MRRCRPEAPRFGPGGGVAVIRYPIKQRAIRFGRSNAWRFDLGAEHPYLYAFADWTFDSNGFPQRRR